MEYNDIQYEKRGNVGYITLNRPDRMNAFTPAMAFELMNCFDVTDADDDIRAVIVTGAGRAFCAGADLSSGGKSFDMTAIADGAGMADIAGTADGGSAQSVDGGSSQSAGGGSSDDGESRWPMVTDEHGNEAPADLGGLVVLRIHRSLKPIIAAINGAAVGVGITMTLPMDIRLCVEDSKIGFVFNRRGISVDGAASWFLPHMVGIGRALEWVNTGRVFTGADAAAAGLVSEALPTSELLLDRAAALAAEIVDNCAPVSVVLSRRLLWDALGDPDPTAGHLRESVALYNRGLSADVRAGVEAFLAKQPPEFVDRVSTSDEVKRP